MFLTLLHFNDLHGRLGQLPRLFTLIDRQRQAALNAGRLVLVLEGGDSSDRGQWESDITRGRANFALLEAMGVQASVIGNGEALQWGRGALAKLVASAHFPVLAANLVDLHDHTQLAVPDLQATCILDLPCDGSLFRVGLVGATAMYPNGYERFGYIALDPLPVIQREVAKLKAEGAQLIVLLSHLGYAEPAEKQKWQDPNAITDDDVARACPDIHIIIGGHSHVKLEAPVQVGSTLIVQAGDYGRYLGQLDIDFDTTTSTLRAFNGQLHPNTESVPIDPTISAIEELVREEANRLLDSTIATATHDTTHAEFAALVADCLRDVCEADVAIYFSGFTRCGMKAGPITRRDLYEAIPGPPHVTAAVVTGAQIQRMITRMLASPYRTQSFNPKRNWPPLGLPACSSNVQLALTPQPPLPAGEGEQSTNELHIAQLLINNEPLDLQRHYRLASTYTTLNDDLSDPEYDYAGIQPGQVVEMIRVEEVLWEIVEGWLKVKPDKMTRWQTAR